MLKITIRPEAQSTRLVLEGRLAGPWVEELDRCWHASAAATQSEVVVDLSGVTFVDSDGKRLLTRLWQEGAELQAVGCLTSCLVAEITNVGRSDSSQSNRKTKTERE